jgi:predicted nuclease of restriction endonuclease-like (RecB) superfamily
VICRLDEVHHFIREGKGSLLGFTEATHLDFAFLEGCNLLIGDADTMSDNHVLAPGVDAVGALRHVKDDHPFERLIEFHRPEQLQHVIAEIRVKGFRVRQRTEDVDHRQQGECVFDGFRSSFRVELERQFKAALFERTVLSPPKVSPLVRQTHPEALSIFRDAYAVEFLGLPAVHAETDLHRGLLDKLKDFLIELGRDFCFVGSEYPLQVGDRDFALDLLFFHRGLNCLVAIELKVDRFEPEYLGKLNFYLEALDRNVRKAHEQPAIGVLLCASKNDEVVEYALSRSLSPALRVPDAIARQEAAAGQAP